nr:spore protein P [Desulfotomaculum nigrificans]
MFVLADNQVHDYVLSTDELKELWAKYGKPGEIAPGVKAAKKRNNRNQLNNRPTTKSS